MPAEPGREQSHDSARAKEQGADNHEKFEDHAAEAAFAVVLLAPDDQGGVMKPRARQNVVLELGYSSATSPKSAAEKAATTTTTNRQPAPVSGIRFRHIHPYRAANNCKRAPHRLGRGRGRCGPSPA
ncbi:TIR domain-containing protein [Arthrobacter sp. efr-133-R2A-63]|uniref:TIR domain-containing protein n=1 Tax=Arthrobacter sp. efr-133-R2A-63 TaxID=3040278 RepID=UPI0033076E44